MKKPKLIGIVGGSCSGKTTFASELKKKFKNKSIVLSQDNYYRGLNSSEEPSSYNFDHPNALDLEQMKLDLISLKKGFPVSIPSYDFNTHKRSNKTINITPPDLLIIEGLFLFSHKEIRNFFDIKVFFNVPETDRLKRRLKRDVLERGRSRDEVLWRFNKHCEPAYKKFILPSAKYADINISPTDGFGSSYENQLSHIIYLLEQIS